MQEWIINWIVALKYKIGKFDSEAWLIRCRSSFYFSFHPYVYISLRFTLSLTRMVSHVTRSSNSNSLAHSKFAKFSCIYVYILLFSHTRIPDPAHVLSDKFVRSRRRVWCLLPFFPVASSPFTFLFLFFFF